MHRTTPRLGPLTVPGEDIREYISPIYILENFVPLAAIFNHWQVPGVLGGLNQSYF